MLFRMKGGTGVRLATRLMVFDTMPRQMPTPRLIHARCRRPSLARTR